MSSESVSLTSARRVRRVIESLERRQLLAAVPTLVKDVNTLPDTSFEPESLFSIGSVAYFTQLDVNLGYELWKTDGTPSGTVLVKDINPGKAWSRPSNFVQLGSTVYFSATTEASGTEVWKTDGTAAGTVLVADVVPGAGSSYATNFRVAGSQLFFFATTPATGYEVWKSDGTAAGTSLITDLRAGPTGQATYSDLNKTGTVGSVYLFLASNGTDSGTFRTDGTAAGTYVLKTSSQLFVGSIVSGGGRAILKPATTSTSFFSTDGTVANTVSFGRAASSKLIAVAGTTVYYIDEIGGIGYQLYRKPLAGGAATQIPLPSGFDSPHGLLPFGNNMAFVADISGSTKLCYLTPTSIGVAQLSNINAYNDPFAPTVLGSSLYFINPDTQQLWKTDGTVGNTAAVVALGGVYASQSNPVKIATVGTRLVLENLSTTTGYELWSTTGTAASLAILKDINTSTAFFGAFGTAVGQIGGTLFYSISDGVTGEELWKTDGTAAGTLFVKDIYSGTIPSQPRYGMTIGNRMLFSANTPTTGRELWVTDGTAGGTSLVLDIAAGSASSDLQRGGVVLNGVAYFVAKSADAGNELWRSDGTAAGTYRVQDIYAGTTGSSIYGLTVFNNKVYFAATTAAAGSELWSTDGTAAGTAMVKDIAGGNTSSSPDWMAVVNNRLYFAAVDSVAGEELWSTDGTSAGTDRVFDLVAGSVGSSPSFFTPIGNTLFFAATTPATGNELFKLDLTTMQASLAADIAAGPSGSNPQQLTRLAGTLCFAAYSGDTRELYTYETGAATKRSDFAAGGGFGIQSFDSLFVANGALFLEADTGNRGIELFEFDGTPTSPLQMLELNAGFYGSAFGAKLALGNAIVYDANTFEYGGELFKLQDTAVPRAWQSAFDVNTGPRVRVDWSEAVIATANTVQLISLATNLPVPGVSVVRTIRADGSGVDYSFSSTLPDGNYRLQFNAADFRDAAGNVAAGAQQLDFFVLAGDINHDRHVDFGDLVILAQNYGKAGQTFSQGNLDYDVNGNVDFGDLVILAQRYNTSVLAAPPASVAAPTKGHTKRGDKDLLS